MRVSKVTLYTESMDRPVLTFAGPKALVLTGASYLLIMYVTNCISVMYQISKLLRL